MPVRLSNLSRPDMGTAAYIRRGPPGPIVELTAVSYLRKIYMKVFIIISVIFLRPGLRSVQPVFGFLWLPTFLCYELIKELVMAILLYMSLVN